MPGRLAPKLVRLRAIGEAPLDPAQLAFAVNVPKPWLAAINPHMRKLKPLAAIRMKWVGDLELESATRVKCQRSVGLILWIVRGRSTKSCTSMR